LAARTVSEARCGVAVLAAGALPLTRFTRHVRAVYRVPAYGPDPLGWWQATLEVLERERPDVLLPTQEQVAGSAAAGTS
jgi:hypothetical protein